MYIHLDSRYEAFEIHEHNLGSEINLREWVSSWVASYLCIDLNLFLYFLHEKSLQKFYRIF